MRFALCLKSNVCSLHKLAKRKASLSGSPSVLWFIALFFCGSRTFNAVFLTAFCHSLDAFLSLGMGRLNFSDKL